jgi:hypothetical protein
MANGSVHVVQTYGISNTVGAIEWIPTRSSWTGQFIYGGIGDFPVGPMFAARGRATLYAAWTQAFLSWDEFPVAVAVHGRAIDAEFVLDRALTTGLALMPRGPVVAANEWVSAAQLGLPGEAVTWAATITGRGGTELDGWIDGVAAVPGTSSEDVLLARSDVLSWFRRSASSPVRVTLEAESRNDGSVVLTGRVRGVRGGTVTLYRERPGRPREAAGTAKLGAGGAFSLVDTPHLRPLVYRAVYTDAVTGIPYARLLRTPVG